MKLHVVGIDLGKRTSPPDLLERRFRIVSVLATNRTESFADPANATLVK